MTYIANSMTKEKVIWRLEELTQLRGEWERGSYKKSTDELYQILEMAFHFIEEIKGKRKLIKEFNLALTANGITWNEGTSLATKVVRYVFNGDKNNKRVYGYARVLIVAQSEKPERESFSAFITRKGGIEEVRKGKVKGKPTKAELVKLHVQTAENVYPTAKSLVSSFACAAPEVHPDAEASHQFSAALLRKNDDGTFSIVFGCNKAAVVKVLLAEGGKVAQDAVTKKALEDQAKTARAARDAALNKSQAA